MSNDKPAEEIVGAGIHVFPDPDGVSKAAADLFTRIVNETLAARGTCAVALTGGKTPCRLYRLLANRPYRHMINWRNVHLFWGDERCVPPDHPDSNFLLAGRTLLDHIKIPETNVHRMRGEDDPDRAAEQYQQILRDVLEPLPGHFPRFDVLLLGLGDDGHVASLFPNGLELGERERFAIQTQKPGGWRRISLTLPVLNTASNVVFLVLGESKAPILHRAVGEPDRFVPASLVRPEGTLYWLVDEPAAGNLTPEQRKGA
jgi:6-phosphogluconolactonase